MCLNRQKIACRGKKTGWLAEHNWRLLSAYTLNLQIPADRHRCHYVKAKVSVHRYSNGELAVFHRPRKLADYNREGKVIPQNLKQAA